MTLTDLKEAEKTLGKAADPAPPRTVQPVSPIVTVTPAERGESACKIAKWMIYGNSVITAILFLIQTATHHPPCPNIFFYFSLFGVV